MQNLQVPRPVLFVTPYSLKRPPTMNISVSDEFNAVCPAFLGAAITAKVVNGPTPEALAAEIERCEDELQAAYTTETLKKHKNIEATRRAYRAAGKDPSRYRPACEQLIRRTLQGKRVHNVSVLVDVMNLVSMKSGYSTAAIDADRLSGESITLGLGRAGEDYEGIGRGKLNIENLPIYRDGQGAFASPTSDSTRTMVTPETRRLLVIINAFDGDREELKKAVDFTTNLLRKYARLEEEEVMTYSHSHPH